MTYSFDHSAPRVAIALAEVQPWLASISHGYFAIWLLITSSVTYGRFKVRINEVSEKLQLHFSRSFPGQIWEQHLSGEYLLLSLRDHDKMEASFSLLRWIDGKPVFEELLFEETWWISVYHFENRVIVFQVHEDSQDIESKSYFCYGVDGQEVIWHLDQSLAVGRQGHFIQMRDKGDSDELFWLDMLSGQVYGELPEEFQPEPISSSCQFPLHYTEGTSHFETIGKYLKRKLAVTLYGACDYLEYQDHILLSFHEARQDHMVLRMVVMDQTGEVLLNRELDSALNGLVSGAFFIVEERLIFVEGRNTLKSYLIG